MFHYYYINVYTSYACTYLHIICEALVKRSLNLALCRAAASWHGTDTCNSSTRTQPGNHENNHIGAVIIRMGLGGILHYRYNNEPPKPYSNY